MQRAWSQALSPRPAAVLLAARSRFHRAFIARGGSEKPRPHRHRSRFTQLGDHLGVVVEGQPAGT